MNKHAPWLVFLFFAVFITASHTPDNWVNCGSYPPSCGGAFCQDKFGNPVTNPNPAVYENTPIKITPDLHIFCGTFEISKCWIPKSCGGSSSPSPQPNPSVVPSPNGSPVPQVCASVQVVAPVNDPRSFPPGEFYGYNWTQEWIDRCQLEPGVPCGAVPKLNVRANCQDSNGNDMSCPTTIQWSANFGELQPDFGPEPDHQHESRLWASPNIPGTATITANVPNCGSASLQIRNHVINTCTISPLNAIVPKQSTQVYDFGCRTSEGNAALCYYPVFIRVGPNDPSPLGTFNVNEIDAQTTQATLSTGIVDGRGEVSGGGPSFFCSTPITVGNPATSCSIQPNPASVELGQTLQFQATCFGGDGLSTACPNSINTFWEVLAQNPGGFGHIGPNGLFIGEQIGAAKVQYRAEGTQFLTPFLCQSDVNIIAPTGIPSACTISPNLAYLTVGETVSLSVYCTQANGAPTGCPPMDWTGPANLVNVNIQGSIAQVTGIGIGQAGIVAQENSPIANAPSFLCSSQLTLSGQPSPVPRGTQGETFIRLDCPLPQIGKNTTIASAFFIDHGQTHSNESMELRVIENNTRETTYLPVHVNAQTGQHEFAFEIPLTAGYVLQAQSDSILSNPCTLSVFQEQTTLLPDMPLLLALLTIGITGFVVRKQLKR